MHDSIARSVGALTALRDAAYQTAVEKGWYDGDEPDFAALLDRERPDNAGEVLSLMKKAFEAGKKAHNPSVAIALMHSELSELLEDLRAHRGLTEHIYLLDGKEVSHFIQEDGTLAKPCGPPSELADVIIRILDLSGKYKVDIERAVIEKMRYNSTRPKRHGNKAF